jgi:hypothetical protein
MAWFYMLAVHCKNHDVAHAFAEKYSGQTFVFNGANDMWPGDVCRFAAGAAAARDEDGWWVHVVPTGVTKSGLSGANEDKYANEFCNVMYEMLRNDRHFDYALPGVEVEEFCSLNELTEKLKTGSLDALDGLVVAKEFCRRQRILDSTGTGLTSLGFEQFSESHLWRPKAPHSLKS